ncbi:Branchpoint-bridging protein [Nosema granulosis]|uniref:Branchpoint-bridging protein n=1 Tax=Nosema granulosis TaxID=83296 RepID=A0A9P6GYS3_9MICR|nr:Branchpoint-bridging protein [Nosema granulosis]
MSFEHQSPTVEILKELIKKYRLKQINKKLKDFKTLPYALQTKEYNNLLIKNKISVSDQECSGFTSKIYLPILEFPKINFTGLILGTNGDTLRQIEQESRSRIFIKGLNKSTEPVHCHIIAGDTASLKRAINIVTGVLEEAIFANKTPQTETPKTVRKGYTDWEKFYLWWYYYNKVQ